MNKGGTPGNLKRSSPIEARLNGSKGGSSPKRKQTLDAQRIMKKLLLAHPPITDKMRVSLETIGADVSDAEMTTNAALMAAVIVTQALDGDLDAVQMALEMGGQITNNKSANDARKLEIEAEKLDIEREKIAVITEGNGAASVEKAREILEAVPSAIDS